MAMSFLPGFAPSSASPVQVLGNVDYRLARNVVVSEYRKGNLSRLDICDAHPELVRAAIDAGEASEEDCPICEGVKLQAGLLCIRPQAAALRSLRCVQEGAGQAGSSGEGPRMLRGRGLPELLLEPSGPGFRADGQSFQLKRQGRDGR